MPYAWQLPEWPNFTYRADKVHHQLRYFVRRLDYLRGQLDAVPEEDRFSVVLSTLVQEASNTFSIEGENLSTQALASSIANNLDPATANRNYRDVRATGIGKVLAMNRRTYADTLTEDVLFTWHGLLLDYRRDLSVIGGYRAGSAPMQIVSGPPHRLTVHFEAPPAREVAGHMRNFISWFNQLMLGSHDVIDKLCRAAISHLYFETIHPFEDGNGRMGRLLLEKALAIALNTPPPFSLSRAIEEDRNRYYAELQAAQRKLDLTGWIGYCTEVFTLAVEQGQELVAFTLRKNRFYQTHGAALNPRQAKAVGKMFAAGPEGFTGGMSTRKYVSIARTSPATATRDLQALVDLGALTRHGAGRGTRYELNLS